MSDDNNVVSKTIICEEVFDETSLPSEEEIIDYARRIGINPQFEPHLLPIALNGLMQPLPDGWKPCYDASIDRWYYYNKLTKKSQWEHPLDSMYRDIVKRGRSEGYSSAAEDDSKGTAKEELKSLEEVSDLLSSRNDKAIPSTEMNDNERQKSHQPLLLRRKQLQFAGVIGSSVENSLSFAVAKMMNNTMRESNLIDSGELMDPPPPPLSGEFLSIKSSSGRASQSVPVTPRQLQPLRRAQTLDPIPNNAANSRAPFIKGILREPSFSDLPNRNLNKNKTTGELTDDLEDDRKRSVRFADPERKSLDIRFQFSDSEEDYNDEEGDDSDSSSPIVDPNIGSSKDSPGSSLKLNLDPESLEIVNQKINAINLNKMKEKMTMKQVDVALIDENISDSSDENNLSSSHSRFNVNNVETPLPAVTEKNGRFIISKTVETPAKRPEDKLSTNEFSEKKNEITALNESKLKELVETLDKDYANKEAQLRADHKKALDELNAELERERDTAIAAVKKEHENVLEMEKQERMKLLDEEKMKLVEESRTQLKQRQESLLAELGRLRTSEENQIEEIKTDSRQKIAEMKERFDAIVYQEDVKYQNEASKVENEWRVKLRNMVSEKEAEFKRVETEWDDKITAATLQHKAMLESALTEHEKSMSLLRQQFQREEEELKKSHAEQVEVWNDRFKKLMDKEPNTLTINRDFEKMRCEKRLIEDKYRSLKDKYLQLKSDMKIAIEKKIQSRVRKKKDEYTILTERDTQDIKTDDVKLDKNKNNEKNSFEDNRVVSKSLKCPKIQIERLHLKEFSPGECIENDPSSDDQFTSLSLTLPNDEQHSLSVSPVRGESNIRRKKKNHRKIVECSTSDKQGNVLDDVRSQLQELEEIEEQIPANSHGDTYLRYPFHGTGLSTSAEVDFYRHRVIVEQEAVRAARECLLQQKRELEARQNILRTNNNTSTMQQLQQQERDLTEMEVSLHRTRSLLGEKMIRLRLLGQTLNRLVDDTPSLTDAGITSKMDQSPGVAGFSVETVPFNVLQNLENINSEIREIWSQLSKQQLEGSITPTDDNQEDKTLSYRMKSKHFTRQKEPRNRAEIEAKLHGLREWLQKPPSPNIDWNQLTL